LVLFFQKKNFFLLISFLLGVTPVQAETRVVKGLKAPIEIVVDVHGIPHIEAQSVEDAFFGQGYAAASARLWQMDIGQRRATGRLAEALGAAFVPYDRAARLMAYRGDLAAAWGAYEPRVKAIAAAWVAGVNARVAEVRADPALLPPEFVALGMVPGFWDVDDLVRARGAGSRNATGEMRRAQLACRGALAMDAVMVPLEPAWETVVPAGLDVCKLARSQLAVLDLFEGPLPFAKAVKLGEVEREDVDARNGSNAWVIGPGMSATGRPILANDPHLGFSVPGPRFITHLRAPGFELAGAGFPSRPGMQFGHTDRIAFGRTDFQIDQQDLYVLKLDEAGGAYRGPDGWEKITRVTEKIAVKGAGDAEVELAFTRLGPVIFEDRAARHGLALRTVGQMPGAAIALEFIPKVLARNWGEFRAALRHAVWGTNYMYADVDGNIGWQAAGWAPRRPGHDGLLPVPAEGRFEWDGVLSLDEMPHEFNPARGWIASANQMPFAADFPAAERKISFEWIADDRYRRIVEVLGAQKTQSVADSVALQHDVVSGRAARVMKLLLALDVPEVAALRGWDMRVTAESEPAALFEFTMARLNVAVHAKLVPADLRDLLTTVHPHVVLAALENPEQLGGAAARDAMLVAALKEAEALLARKADRSWGAVHALDLRHDVGGITGANVGTRSGGDGSTVMARWWASPAKPQASGGALFAGVFDVGNWDASLAINAPGQDGDPRSRHYGDLLQAWSDGVMFPLPFSPASIAAVAERRITLTPGG
jgi:penicillin amidase